MANRTFDVRADRTVTPTTEPQPAVRSGEFVARAVAVIGGASLAVGGLIGYALGYLEGMRGRRDHDEV